MPLSLKKIFDRLFYENKLIYTTESKYNHLEVWKQNEKFILNSRNTNYSFGGLHKVFQTAFQKYKLNTVCINDVLILGFGGGSIAHIFRKELKCSCKITGVEIDPKVIELAKQYFSLKDIKNIDIRIQDASQFVDHCYDSFDIIAVDLFIDHRIPGIFNGVEFLRKLNQLLNKEGLVFYNRLSYDYKSSVKTGEFDELFRKVFSNTKLISIKGFSKNKVFVGTRNEK